MDVTLLVTKTDFSVANLKCEFDNLGMPYSIEYVENNPELVSTHCIRHSPNIFVDGNLIFRHQPSPTELKDYFAI